MTKVFERIFTDNSQYADYEEIPYLDALAYTVQEFLYTEKAKNIVCDMRMDKHIKLPDFMTLTVYFVSKSVEDFGRTAIKDYIEEMKQDRQSVLEKVEYKNDALMVSNASSELILAVLWAANLYAAVRSKSSTAKWWGNAQKILYETMKENCVYSEERFREYPNMVQTSEAVIMMRNHIEQRQTKEPISMFNKTEKPRSKKEKEEGPDKAVFYEINWHDKVRLDLLLRLMENDGADLERHGNKMKAATIMQSITGLPLQTCKNYCTNRDLNVATHSEEVLKMNTLLQSLDMKIRL